MFNQKNRLTDFEGQLLMIDIVGTFRRDDGRQVMQMNFLVCSGPDKGFFRRSAQVDKQYLVRQLWNQVGNKVIGVVTKEPCQGNFKFRWVVDTKSVDDQDRLEAQELWEQRGVLGMYA